MATIYCSTKHSTHLGLPKKSNQPPTVAVDSHCGNALLFYLNKRKCILFVNKQTLYSFLAFDIVKKDLLEVEIVEGIIDHTKENSGLQHLINYQVVRFQNNPDGVDIETPEESKE